MAILAPSDLGMLASLFALSRLGYTVMMLSPRLAADACVSLLDGVGCSTILHGQTVHIQTTMQGIQSIKKSIIGHPVPSEAVISAVNVDSVLVTATAEQNAENIALIMHSSGSTGTPKPLLLSHRALMTIPLHGSGLSIFGPLPWFHMYGIGQTFQAFWMRKTFFAWHAMTPVTGQGLVRALEAAQPESVCTVPYILQLIAEADGGIEALRRCTAIHDGFAAS